MNPDTRRGVRALVSCWLLLGLALLLARGDDAPPRARTPGWLLPTPEIEADPQLPTLAQVVGHRWGQDISSHAEIERYCQALAKAAPERCRLVEYGRTYQGKALYYLILSSPENLKALEAIRTRNLALGDARTTTASQAAEIAAKSPAVVWLAYCVHGNETSPSDAALLTAYHLLADRRAQTRELLEKLVVVIDPVQNPDGRDRFVNYHRDRRGVTDQDHPLAVERLEQWPSGRLNHYLFDMNRDWYLHTQKETAARVAAFLRWKPQIFVDAHEMGADSSFFFDPSSEPHNPHVLARQKDWQMKIGRHHAELFDRNGFAYTTREMFDGFGPQYGSTWPILHGSVAFLWEQAGVRGRVITREDQSKLYYHDGVRHHYISGLATLEAAARSRQQLLLDFHKNAADSITLGETGPMRAFYLLEGKRPARAADLARLLQRNGIEVRRTTASGKTPAAEIVGQTAREYTIP
ncbi:MAG: peptidase M14, partial [Planctomycetia bacterium]|nr:peptidase M14 [Planctomycetia bacterium]